MRFPQEAKNNIFGIPSPEGWECHVHYFVIGHAELLIHAYTPDIANTVWIKFFQVEYFSGWIRWKGADFRYGAYDECTHLLEATPRFTKPLFPDLRRMYSLYQVDTGSSIIKIVAASAELFPDYPDPHP